MRNYGNHTTIRLPSLLQFPENPIAISLTLKLSLYAHTHTPTLYIQIHMYYLQLCMYIRTELDVRQQGAAFGSQVRHSRRQPGRKVEFLGQGGGGEGEGEGCRQWEGVVTQIGCKIVLT